MDYSAGPTRSVVGSACVTLKIHVILPFCISISNTVLCTSACPFVSVGGQAQEASWGYIQYIAAVLCALLLQPGLGSHWLNWSVTSTLTYTVTPSVFMHAGPQVIDDQVPYSLEAPGVTV